MLKNFSKVLTALMMMVLVTSMFVEIRYSRTRPITPRESTGNVHPVNIRGKVVYLDWSEYMLHAWLFPAGLFVGFAGAAMWLAAGRQSGSLSK